MSKKIIVTAGRKGNQSMIVYLPTNVMTAPGNRVYVVKEGDKVEVDPNNYFIRRSLRNGDLMEVKPTTSRKKKGGEDANNA